MLLLFPAPPQPLPLVAARDRSSAAINGDGVAAGTSGRPLDLYTCFETLPDRTRQNPTLARAIHAKILKCGLHHSVDLVARLHAHSAASSDAAAQRAVFDGILKRDVLTWNVLIKACASAGQHREFLDLYSGMLCGVFVPDEFTLPVVLNACAALSDLPAGEAVHTFAVKCGLAGCAYVASALISMYAECGLLESAEDVFDGAHERDLATWNSLITGFAKQGDFVGALTTFARMRWADVVAGRNALSSAISACGRLKEPGIGQEDYSRLRPLSYRGADIFVLALSLISRASYENVLKKWMPELRRFAPNFPIVLVGTKLDKGYLGNHPSASVITSAQGEELRKQIGAAAYIECRPKTQQVIHQRFFFCTLCYFSCS